MAGTRSDAETMAAEAGGEDEAGQFAGFANGRHTIRRAVDEARPGGGNPGFAEGRQKLQCPFMGLADGGGIGFRIENTNPFHRRRRIEPPAFQRLVAAAKTFQPAWPQASPALEKHRNKFTGKPHLLRRRVDAAQPADGESIAAVFSLRG
ncbi:hypothetical protein D3C78_1529330 [compost metagenome]